MIVVPVADLSKAELFSVGNQLHSLRNRSDQNQNDGGRGTMMQIRKASAEFAALGGASRQAQVEGEMKRRGIYAEWAATLKTSSLWVAVARPALQGAASLAAAYGGLYLMTAAMTPGAAGTSGAAGGTAATSGTAAAGTAGTAAEAASYSEGLLASFKSAGLTAIEYAGTASEVLGVAAMLAPPAEPPADQTAPAPVAKPSTGAALLGLGSVAALLAVIL